MLPRRHLNERYDILNVLRLVLNPLVISLVLLAIGCASTQETPIHQIQNKPVITHEPRTNHAGFVTYVDWEKITIVCEVCGKEETFYVDPQNPAVVEMFRESYIKPGYKVLLIAVGDRVQAIEAFGED